MKDPRITKLAHQLIDYSVNLQPGEKLLIETDSQTNELTKELVRLAYQKGGQPFVSMNNSPVLRELLMDITDAQLTAMAEWDSARMEQMDAYIGIRAKGNAFEMSGVPAEKMQAYASLYQKPVHHDIRVAKTKWVILRYPNDSMAQSAEMATDDFEDFFFDVCNLNYAKMDKAMDALQALMNRTDKVHIVAPGTDLTFSIKGIGAIKCAGNCNIPDGEVYTAPVKDSVNGVISYNVASPNQGIVFRDIKLTFKDGKIIEATAADHNEELNAIFDTDPGARYVGEFAIGVNPYVLFPLYDILFDEKICGSIHFTPGACYDDAYNGNQSAVHWDLVAIHRPEYGGGEIYFDDVLIRKDGRFVLPELDSLNPENLK